MHCKPPKLKVKQQHMASLSTGGGSIGGGSGGGGAADDDGDGSRSGKSVTLVGHSPGSYAAKNSNSTNNNNKNNSGNNNNNNDSTISANNNNNNTSLDSTQIQLKKQTLEQRKQELEKLLSEKSWLLQQLQKQEAQILNGNYEYLNLNDIFGTLQQCKQDAAGGSVGGGSGGGGSAILRRKTTTGVTTGGSAAKENLINNNNTSGTQSNRHSEISNRSSEYDNYPGVQQVATQQLPAGGGILKVAQKKRVNSSTWQTANTLPQAQQQQQLQQQHLQQQQEQLQKQQEQLHKTQLQQQQHLQQLRQHYISQMSEEQHFQYTQQQVLQHQQQMLQQHLQQQQRQMLQHQHFHPRQQLITAYHSPTLPTQAVDAISLYSANSANVATLRQQPAAHLAQMQTPITVQCDKYYLSPTHQSYNDGGFIRSSQNIKQYISPQSSPTTTATLLKPLQPLQLQQQQQQQQSHLLVNNRNFDAISLSPQNNSLISPEQNNNENNNTTTTTNINTNLRWRSQSSIATKNHSSDTLNAPSPGSYFPPSIPKHMDDISVASFGSDTQKKQKSKQWMESSLDGPVIRSTNNNSPVSQQQQPPRPHQAKPPTQQLNMPRDRTRLSSQSMSSGAQRYNGVAQRSKTTRLLQDDDGKYAKLSQSTSYLNSMDALAVNTSYFPEPLLTTAAAAVPSPLPARSELSYNFISPKGGARLLPASVSIATADKPALSPEIRIESPKNMTVVQQATFQPYKEITKPFEMSDFYKYSTKFKQKEPVTTATGGSRVDGAQDK